MEKNERIERETEGLFVLLSLEDLLEKKTKIYARLLTEVSMAQNMEKLALRHEQRKERIEKLIYGKPLKKKNGQGMSAMNEEEGEE